MQLKFDVKTLIVGIALGIAITAAIGASVGSADADRFGIAVQPQGSAVVRTSDGDFYVITPENAMATRILLRRNLSDDPDRSRDSRGWFFNLRGTRRQETTATN